jgi:hypothetical protein
MKTLHEIAQFLLSQPDKALDDQGESKTKEHRYGNVRAIDTQEGGRLWIKYHSPASKS